jgi:hypothetical protein
MAEEKDDLTTRDQALRVARMLGCQGAHETEKGWMPCLSHEEYEAIKKGKEEYLKVLAAKKKKPLPKMVQRTKRLETKSDAYYENRADAVAISKARGCGGVRTVLLAGKKYYAVCNHKAPKRGWENLDEKPISGIATLPGGGLVTGSFSGKSIEGEVDDKGFVNFVSRSTDPDTFSNPESARIRARNLGCIGIRRYTARDGKLVWLPCTNVSDYNRVTGIRGDNSPRNNPRRRPRNNPRRQGSKFGKKVLDTPANGMSEGMVLFKGVPKARKKPPTVTSTDINNLAIRVRQHNAKAKASQRANLRDLKNVYMRGLEDGDKTSANKRVSKFLSLLMSDKPKDVKYFDDNDLLPLNHPWRNRKTNKKRAGFDDGEYGVKYTEKCCPQVVKRYHAK